MKSLLLFSFVISTLLLTNVAYAEESSINQIISGFLKMGDKIKELEEKIDRLEKIINSIQTKIIFSNNSTNNDINNNSTIIPKIDIFIEGLKAEYIDVSYRELVLNSNAYLDKNIHYKGKIIDIRDYISAECENCFTQYELTLSQHTGMGNYDQPIHVIYDTKNDPKLKERDNIELWGTFTQLVPITTGFGQHVKIPDVWVYGIEIEIIE